MDSSSDDSDIGDYSRNVQSVLIKSSAARQEVEYDYAYKRRLGDLIFDADFEAGNLGYIEVIDQYEYDLMIRPDLSSPKHRVWFNFKLSNQKIDQCVVLTFVNLSENLNWLHEGLCPVIRSRRQPDWLHLSEDQVFYYKSKDHGDRYVLSLAIRFSTQADEHQIALLYPYTCSTLASFLNQWEVELKRHQLRRAQGLECRKLKKKKTTTKEEEEKKRQRRAICASPELWKRPNDAVQLDHDEPHLRTRSSIGNWTNPAAADDELTIYRYDLKLESHSLATSALCKPIYCVSISDSNRNPKSLHNPIVIVICRFGGNLDGSASYVCQGIMDYLLSDCIIARAARESIDFYTFPMIDPDSIACGNSRTDLAGRQFHESVQLIDSGPTVYANFRKVKDRVLGILSEGDETRRAIVLELKVNLDLVGLRILGAHFEDSFRMERHLSFPKVLSRFAIDFYLEACRFSDDTNSWLCRGTSRDVDHYQLEMSPFGSYQRSLGALNYTKFDQARCKCTRRSPGLLAAQMTFEVPIDSLAISIQPDFSIGKAIVYSLVELLRQKRADHVAALLDKFQHHTSDVDDLTLNESRSS